MNLNSEQTFIITGGAGFIGSNLVRKILKLGSYVIVIDDLSSGKFDNIPKHKNLTFVKKSVQDIDWTNFFNISG